MKKLDNFFSDLFLKKAPQLSENKREIIAKATGWVVLVFGLMAVPGIIKSLGFGKITPPFWAVGSNMYARWMVIYIIGIIQVALGLVAVPHLFKLNIKGWQLLYWAMLVGLLSSLLQLSVFGLLISFAFLYFLYQIKTLYKK